MASGAKNFTMIFDLDPGTKEKVLPQGIHRNIQVLKLTIQKLWQFFFFFLQTDKQTNRQGKNYIPPSIDVGCVSVCVCVCVCVGGGGGGEGGGRSKLDSHGNQHFLIFSHCFQPFKLKISFF